MTLSCVQMSVCVRVCVRLIRMEILVALPLRTFYLVPKKHSDK